MTTCNCSEWRLKAPSDTLNKPINQSNGWFAKLIHFSGFVSSVPSFKSSGYNISVSEWLFPSDLIIFQRNIIIPEVLDAIRYWQGMGKPVLVDLDDSYPMLPISNPAYEFWQRSGQNNTPKTQGQDKEALRLLIEGVSISDGLIAPNRNLLSDFHALSGSRSYYVQNFARSEWWSDLPSKEELRQEKNIPSDRIVIGWGGSISHRDSWWGSGLYEAAEVLTAKYPNLLWLICGNDKRVLDDIPVPNSNKLHMPSVEPHLWPRNVKLFDVGVAPLFWSYDHRRSWIKGIEYLLAGVPWIGSAGGMNGTYSDLVDLGYVIENGKLNWFNQLEYMINNLDQEKQKAESLIPLARQSFLVDNQVEFFRQMYSKMIDDTRENKQVVLPGLARV